MTINTSEYMYWNDEWLAVKIGYAPISNDRIIHAQYKSNGEWYYGQGDTIPQAIEAMEEKIAMLRIHGKGPHAVAMKKQEKKQDLGDIF